MSTTELIDPHPMPAFDEVYQYALTTVRYHIKKIAAHLSNEQKEEIVQETSLRVWKAYQKFTPDLGWKSFIGFHCRGAVQDFLKGGSFEDGMGLNSDQTDALRFRVELVNDDDDVISVENTAAIYGIHINDEGETVSGFDPHWELLSKMAGQDESIMIIGKMLLGYSQEEIAEQSEDDLKKGVSRERVSQRIYELFNKMDSPFYLQDPWINQCIYALGLSATYHMKEHDNGLGHDLPAYDLNDPLSFKQARRWVQPSFFDKLDCDNQPIVVTNTMDV